MIDHKGFRQAARLARYQTDPRLSEANDAVTKAIALLKAAENPDPKREFGGHRAKAVELLTRAQGEIGKAIDVANEPPKPPKPTKPPKP